MNRAYTLLLLALALPGLRPGAALAQEDPSTAASLPVRAVVEHQPYRSLEVVGLRRWSMEMLNDSLNAHAPGMSLFDHGCAATLRYELGFAEAASFIVQNPSGRRGRLSIVLLIEPQDSALVRHRELPRDTVGSTAPWHHLVDLSRSDRSLLRDVALTVARSGADLGSDVPEVRRAQIAAARPLFARYRGSEDLELATRILTSSPHLHDRMAAVAVLSGFPDEDAAWHALTGAMLESDGPVRSFASSVLATFAHFQPREVDWSPAHDSVRDLLNGGSLFQLPYFVNVLLSSGVTAEDAVPMLRGGGHGLLMLARLEYGPMREPAMRLLRALAPTDVGGDDADAWERWIGRL